METWAENALSGFVKGITNSIPGVSTALDALKKLFPSSPPEEGPLAEVTDANMTSFAGGLISSFSSGITNTTPTVNSALGNIANMFPHSPVESGPLADVTTSKMENYGSSLVDALATGITTATPAVTSALQNITNDVNTTVSNAEGALDNIVTGTSSSVTPTTTSTNVASSATATAAALNTLTTATTVAAATTSSASASLMNATDSVDSVLGALDSAATPILSSIEQANVTAQSGATAQSVEVNFHPNSIQLPDGVTPQQARNIAGGLGMKLREE